MIVIIDGDEATKLRASQIANTIVPEEEYQKVVRKRLDDKSHFILRIEDLK